MPLFRPDTTKPVLEQFSLSGKTCLGAGGGRGIGLETVQGLAEAGVDVTFTYLTSIDAPETARRVAERTGQKIESWQADVTRRGDIAGVVQRVVDTFGRLDVVVANAGVCAQIPSLECTEK